MARRYNNWTKQVCNGYNGSQREREWDREKKRKRKTRHRTGDEPPKSNSPHKEEKPRLEQQSPIPPRQEWPPIRSHRTSSPPRKDEQPHQKKGSPILPGQKTWPSMEGYITCKIAEISSSLCCAEESNGSEHWIHLEDDPHARAFLGPVGSYVFLPRQPGLFVKLRFVRNSQKKPYKW